MTSLYYIFIALSLINVAVGRKTRSMIADKNDEVTYIGAVLEFAPYDTWTDEGQGLQIITTNAQTIVEFAKQAKNQNADIFVAPEYGIQSLNIKEDETENFLTFTQYVPMPTEEITPCLLANDTSRVDAIRILSCAAYSLDMYLVIALAELSPCNYTAFASDNIYWDNEVYSTCPEEGYYAFNTQVVFDRTGKIAARYRKQHLFLEPAFTPGPTDNSLALFVTDFDVLFSLQICFDIMYEGPGYYNVKYGEARDIAMSTAWVDYLPFHLADSVQNSFSRGLGTNMMVSGYHSPARAKMGSGIYRAYKEDLPVYTYDKDSGNVLLVASITTRTFSSIHGSDAPNIVPTNQSSCSTKKSNLPVDTESTMIYGCPDTAIVQSIIHEDISDFTANYLSPLMPGETKVVTGCSDDSFCCSITYEYAGNQTYAFLVFRGQFTVGSGTYLLGLQLCGVVWCEAENITTCAQLGPILPSSDYFGPYTMESSSFSVVDIYPMGLHRDFSLVNNNELFFDETTNSSKVHTSVATKDHLMSGLYGRWYANDA